MTLYVSHHPTRNVWTAYTDDERFYEMEGTQNKCAFQVVEDWAEQNIVPLADALDMLSLVSLGWVIEPYHDGGAIYAVMSRAINDTTSDPSSIASAIFALRHTRQHAKFSEAVTDEDVRVNDLLADALERRFADLLATIEEE